jgi:light-regulated signal transduction histidine kinase (bacteriophytochrome)
VKFIQTIQKQNDKLKSIAWIQSHIVRAPLARMMGLIDMLKEDIPTDIDEKELLGYLLDSASELDKIIHDISEKAEEVDYNIEKARNV